VPLYGANHNYLTFSPLQTGNNMVRGSGASNTSVMVRYE
jgi:hypothetical protein